MVKLEVGKYYKSCDGRKWKCVHEFDSRADHPMLCVLIDGGSCIEYRYTKDGRYDAVFDDEDEEDLISEWVEPVEHEVDVVFNKGKRTGAIYASNFGEDDLGETIAKVKVKFTEGEGL